MRLFMGLMKDRHGTYYAVRKVPNALQEAVAQVLDKGKQQQVWLKRSLATKDLSEAKKRIKPVQIKFDGILDAAMGLLAERPTRTTLSDAEIKLIAEHHYADMLHSDDVERREGMGRDAMMRSIAAQLDAAGVEYDMPIPPSESTPQFGLSEADLKRRAADLNFETPIMRAALAAGDISKISEYLDELLDVFGINLDRKSEAYRRLGLAVLRRHVAALDALRQRADGQPIETPALAALPAIGDVTAMAGDTLNGALEGWKRQRERAPGTITEYERAIRLFTELHGDMPVAQIKRSHARTFREALQNMPRARTGKLLKAPLPEVAEWGREHPDGQKIGAGTINKLLGGVQAVCRWARREHLLPDDWADPFAEMRLEEDESERAPFDLEDLKRVFSAPVFTKGERPVGGQGEAAFWLPVLALFGGERLSELAGLRISDVAYNQLVGAVCIYIRREKKAGRRVKTPPSERYLPLHPKTVELGFIDFVQAQATARGESAWLFPKIAPRTKGAAAFSKWFGRYIGGQGITDTRKVFHSFRHTFIDALRLANVDDELRRALLGWAVKGMPARYGAKDKAAQFRHRLAEAVANVIYEDLDLSRARWKRADPEAA